MDTMSGPKRVDDAATTWEALLSAVAGVAVLWAAWVFYHDRLWSPGVEWYAWVRPALLVLGGVLSLVAAALLAARRPGGRGVLRLAVGVIPLFLVAGLPIVAVRFAGFVIDAGRGVVENADRLTVDALLDRLGLGPLALANVVVVALIILVALLSKADKSGTPQRDRLDER